MRERAVEEQLVEEQFTAWVRYMNNARVDSMLSVYHDSPALRVMWSDGSRQAGFEAVEQTVRDFYGSISYMNFVPQSPEFQVLDRDVAVSTFRHSTDIVLAGGNRLPVASGQGTIVWIKDHDTGDWKIHVQQIAVNASSIN